MLPPLDSPLTLEVAAGSELDEIGSLVSLVPGVVLTLLVAGALVVAPGPVKVGATGDVDVGVDAELVGAVVVPVAVLDELELVTIGG
jgi:hypothetical protein